MATRLLRRPEVEARVGLGRSALYRLISEGRFPAPVRLTDRAVAWHEEEVDEWIEERRRERDAAAAEGAR